MNVNVSRINKSIAEFIKESYGEISNDGCLIQHLNILGQPIICYHDSWNDLMPVYKKIIDYMSRISVVDNEDGFRFYEMIKRDIGDVNIRGAHYFIGEFIGWYNIVNLKEGDAVVIIGDSTSYRQIFEKECEEMKLCNGHTVAHIQNLYKIAGNVITVIKQL